MISHANITGTALASVELPGGHFQHDLKLLPGPRGHAPKRLLTLFEPCESVANHLETARTLADLPDVNGGDDRIERMIARPSFVA